MATKDMTNKMQKVLRSICETMLRHPDVKIWTFNNSSSVDVTQWDGTKQIHYNFYEWHNEDFVNTQLDNLEQMCWIIQEKQMRRETDDENINYSTERTNH